MRPFFCAEKAPRKAPTHMYQRRRRGTYLSFSLSTPYVRRPIGWSFLYLLVLANFSSGEVVLSLYTRIELEGAPCALAGALAGATLLAEASMLCLGAWIPACDDCCVVAITSCISSSIASDKPGLPVGWPVGAGAGAGTGAGAGIANDAFE